MQILIPIELPGSCEFSTFPYKEFAWLAFLVKPGQCWENNFHGKKTLSKNQYESWKCANFCFQKVHIYFGGLSYSVENEKQRLKMHHKTIKNKQQLELIITIFFNEGVFLKKSNKLKKIDS